ncbi:MAG: NYN domain-containing protein [Actinobacteria bacterium]|nr:NYN domain-containing protein [Actinomycetota bacterium]
MSTIVYVDGFNLYHRAIKRTPHRWVDLSALCDRVLGEQVVLVRYFTARVSSLPRNPDAPTRQQALLRVYEADPRIEIHYGKFRLRDKTGDLRSPVPKVPTVATVRTYEEKGSDVNLGAHALADAYEGRADKVVLLTNDSDLAEVARLLQQRGTPVGVVIPRKGLKPKTVPADFYKTLRFGDLAACQLPNPSFDSLRREVWKPERW